MARIRKYNPAKPNYDPEEILRFCKQTRLTYPEVAIFLGVPLAAVIRICSKQAKRAIGRPPRLTKNDIENKIKQVINVYKKNRRHPDKSKIDKLRSYLTEKFIKESRQTSKIEPEFQSKTKRVVKRRIRPSMLPETRLEGMIPPKLFKLSQEQALVIDFLVEKHRKSDQGLPFTMATFAKHKGINYDNFTRLVKRHIPDVLHIANEMIARDEQHKLGEKYRYYVIDYLARQELLADADEPLTKLEYVEQNQLDHSIFMKYYRKLRHEVRDEVLRRYRELEEERLQKLRAEMPAVEIPMLASVSKEKERTLNVLEKAARRKLPIRKGHIVFHPNAAENKRLEEIWLQIADDIARIGPRDAIADKWAYEMGLPPNLSREERNYLILTRIETILKQIDLWTPPLTLKFDEYVKWIENNEKKQSVPIATSMVPPSAPEPTHVEIRSVPVTSEEDEAWLEAEIVKEEAEMRRFLDSPEERARRRREGLVIPATEVSHLKREQIEEMLQLGGFYDSGDWLMAAREDVEKFIRAPSIQLAGWTLNRKPKLLVAIGTTDYTKDWMKKVFDLELADNPATFAQRYNALQPDAILIYKSSTGRQLYEAVITIGNETRTPLLIFDKGFADVLLSAQKQGLQWFVDAYNKRRSYQRQHNPIPWLKYYQYRYR